MAAFLLTVFWLVTGFLIGRLYQWAKAHGLGGDSDTILIDPARAAREAALDIAATTRRAEEQLRNLNGRSEADPYR